MSIDINSDNNINKLRPDFSIPETQSLKINSPVENAVNIEKDGANLNNSKGKVPASGFSFNSSESPQLLKTAEKFLTYFLNDSSKLSSFSSTLEKLATANSIEDLNEQDMLSLMQLGFDVTMENGRLLVRDSSGNAVNPDDLMKGIETLQNTVKRASVSLANGNISQAAIEANQQPFVPKTEDIKQINDQVSKTNEITKDTELVKAKLEKNKAEYLQLSKQVEVNNSEIDTTVSQILILREKAQKIISSSKETNKISESDRNELKSIESNIKIKQAKLSSIQDSSELLVKQAAEVFNGFAPELNDSERSTMSELQNALEAKVSGKSLTARQNFLSTISADIYNLTSGMNDEELKNVLSDTGARVKMLAPINKMLERVKSANSISDLDKADIDLLWTKFKIKAVDNGQGGFDLFYHGNKGSIEKLSKDDLNNYLRDLNNIVSSPTLFNYSRAAGQLIVAYDKNESMTSSLNDLKEKSNSIGKLSSDNSSSKPKEEIKFSDSGKDFVDLKADQAEKTYLAESIDKIREESQYHEKQLKSILDNRREINRYIENKRLQEKMTTNNP